MVFEEKIDNFVDGTVEKTNLLYFRKDFLERFRKEYDGFPNNIDREKYFYSIKKNRKKALDKWRSWNNYLWVIGLINTILGYFFQYLGLAIFFYFSFIFVFEIGLRKVFVDKIGYKNPNRNNSDEELITMNAWNRGILTNSLSMAAVYFMGGILKFYPSWYNRIMEYLQKMIKKKIESDKSLFEIGYEVYREK